MAVRFFRLSSHTPFSGSVPSILTNRLSLPGNAYRWFRPTFCRDPDLTSEIYYILLAVFVLVIISTLYSLGRLLHWSQSRPLPGTQNPVLSIAVVCLVAVVAILLLLDVELMAVFGSLKEPVLTIFEATNLLAVIAVSLAVIVILTMLKRIKQ